MCFSLLNEEVIGEVVYKLKEVEDILFTLKDETFCLSNREKVSNVI
jgi:hypothetical protein